MSAAWQELDRQLPGVRSAEEVHAVIVLGGVPGWIHLTVWPTEDNVAKIPACAVHELSHNVRYANVAWNPMTVTVGEQVIAEGLAEAFVRELHGDEAVGPWTKTLHGEELVRAEQIIADAVGLAGMQNLTPYVHGDETTLRMGGQPVGLPHGAGYAVGLAWVDRHLAVTGLTASESTVLPATEILRNAGIATQ